MNAILTINAGSSSVKYALFELDGQLTKIDGGKVGAIKQGDASAHEDAVSSLVQNVRGKYPDRKITHVAHRIVHGGLLPAPAILVTSAIIKSLEELAPCAPLHQHHNLAAIDIVGRNLPEATQYACCDTAFHTGHNPLHDMYALPQNLRDKSIRKYGFHGLSYAWIARQLKEKYPSLCNGKIVAAHLGNGASACAMENGKSVDTTMGFTALDGLPMGTRCGAIDPGVILYLEKTLGMSPEQVEHLLYNESGLLGLSGLSNDVKTLEESNAAQSRIALDYFAFKTAQHIAMMSVSLGGMNALVFTGGIGENSSNIRAKIVEHVAFLGNFETLVIPADEERMMALHVAEIINGH
ncbi:MAG: acetate/propionate family kinase [Pseudobdellovibrionaceae bacterium]